MQEHVPNPSDAVSRWLCLLALIVIVVLVGVAWVSENPPAERISESGFSATHALTQLRTIVGEATAHPTGSLKNAEELDRIEKATRGLGYASERQSSYLCNETNDCMQLHNLIVRIPGQTDGPAVLIDAHYDSVSAGPGVADNGSGVAIALEIARQIHSGLQLKLPLVLLFDDAEEQELLGSQAFVHSAYARNVAWAVNLDARGVRGPSLMYQTSANNASLMVLYQRSTHNPVANSLMSAVYERLPSSTDFSILRDHGIQGFNLAYLGGTAFYHTSGDDLAHLDPKSVQHQGEEALALTRALATDPPPQTAQGDAAYFDLFRHEIVWPRRLCLLLIGAGFVLLVFSALFRAQKLQAAAYLRGAATLLVTSLLSAGGGFALLWVLYPNAHFGPQFPAHPAPSILAFVALGLALSAFVFSLVPVKALLREYFVGYWASLTLVSIALYLLLFGGSYLTIAPVLVGSASLTLAVLWGIEKPESMVIAVFGSTLGAAVLWIPLLRLLYLAQGEIALPVIGCIGSATALLILPFTWAVRLPLKKAATGALAITAVAAIVAFLVPRYSTAAPFAGANLFCVQTDSGQPRWVLTMPKKYLPQVSELIRVGNFTPERHPETLAPFSSTNPVYTAFAATKPLPAVELQVLKKTTSANAVCFDTRLTAPGEVDRISALIPPTTVVKALRIGGQVLSPMRTASGWTHFSSTLDGGGVEADICLDPKGGNEMYLDAVEFGLPPAGLDLMKARGNEALQVQDGDRTYHYRHIRLGTE